MDEYTGELHAKYADLLKGLVDENARLSAVIRNLQMQVEELNREVASLREPGDA